VALARRRSRDVPDGHSDHMIRESCLSDDLVSGAAGRSKAAGAPAGSARLSESLARRRSRRRPVPGMRRRPGAAISGRRPGLSRVQALPRGHWHGGSLPVSLTRARPDAGIMMITVGGRPGTVAGGGPAAAAALARSCLIAVTE
jgi:hypothetical protein